MKIYDFLMRLALVLIQLFRFIFPKIHLWFNGQDTLFERLEQQNFSQKTVLFHCASLGEYEQGKPVIDLFKYQHPDYQVVVSFFSPSGFEPVLHRSIEDFVTYLPFDTQFRVQQFLDIVQPQLVFLVKYEFWPNLINELSFRQIPIVCFSAVFRPSQAYFKFNFFKDVLRKVNLFFVQNEESKNLLQSIDIQRVAIQEDTRLERILSRKSNRNFNPKIKQFTNGQKCFLLGSVYAEDTDLFNFEELQKSFDKILIFPHEIGQKSIDFWLKKLPSASLYSTENQQFLQTKIMIIDAVGHLADAYQFAAVAYVGGAFNKGLHNVLEAAVFGIPVFIGAGNHQKFLEVAELKDLEMLHEVKNSKNLLEKLQYFEKNPAEMQKKSEICIQFLENKPRPAERILEIVKLKISLES